MDYYVMEQVENMFMYAHNGNINQYAIAMVENDKILTETLANNILEVIRDKKQQENDLHEEQGSLF